jgi:hypothetical protein
VSPRRTQFETAFSESWNYWWKVMTFNRVIREKGCKGKGKGEGKFLPVFLFLTEHHAKKAYWGRRNTAPRIH